MHELANYLKSTHRNFFRQKVYSFINVFDLVIAISAFMVICLFPLNLVFSQATFQKALGGAGEETCNDIITVENNYFLAGHTTSLGSGSYDFLLMKTDNNGNQIWARTYGKQAEEIALAVSATNDGGIIMTGYSNSFGSDNILVVKTDFKGEIEWSKTYAGVFSSDWGYDIIQTMDGGFIIAGRICTAIADNAIDLCLIKTDEVGNIQWSKIYGDEYINIGKKVIQTTDGGYLVIGITHIQHGGPSDIYLVKTDSNGIPLWSNTYGGDGWDFGNFVLEKDDGYLVGGHGDLLAYGMSDIILKFLDLNGTIIWSKVYGGLGSEWGDDMILNEDGSVTIIGLTNSTGNGNTDFLAINTDTEGNPLWTKVFGGISFDHGICLAKSNNQYLFSGYTESFGHGQNDMYLIKTDLQGVSGCFENSWEINYQDFTIQSDTLNIYSDFLPEVNSVLLDQQDQIVLSENICISSDIFYPEEPGNVQVFPNPFSDELNFILTNLKDSKVFFEIIDIKGKQVLKKYFMVDQENLKTQINLPNPVPGLYFIHLFNNVGFMFSKKILCI